MKRNSFPMSALLTGLLAMPAIGLAPPASGNTQPSTPIVHTQSFPAEMPPELPAQLRRITRGQKPDAFGMQSLQRRLALQMQERLQAKKK